MLNGTGLNASGNRAIFAIDSGNYNPLTKTYTGTIVLSTNSQIKGATGTEIFNNGATIEGAGSINNLWTSNYGVLKANVSGGTMTINPAP
ncbi:MAG: hypothetical protein ACRD11_02065 [Terriglobia bacterium]